MLVWILRVLVLIVGAAIAAGVYILIGSFVVGTIARMSNHRVLWEPERGSVHDNKALISWSIVLWPFVMIGAIFAVPARRIWMFAAKNVEKQSSRPLRQVKTKQDW